MIVNSSILTKNIHLRNFNMKPLHQKINTFIKNKLVTLKWRSDYLLLQMQIVYIQN